MQRVKAIHRPSPEERARDTANLRAYNRGDAKWQKLEQQIVSIESEWQLPALPNARHDPDLDRAGERYEGEKADSAVQRWRWAREIRAAAFSANGEKIDAVDRARSCPGWWMANAYRLQTSAE